MCRAAARQQNFELCVGEEDGLKRSLTPPPPLPIFPLGVLTYPNANNFIANVKFVPRHQLQFAAIAQGRRKM